MEESLPNYHEEHIAGKGDNSLQHYNLVHKFIPLLQAMKIPAARATVDTECEKLEKIPAWDLTNSTPHTSPFSRSQRARVMCDTTLAQVLVRVIPSMCHAPE